jgi:DNA-binding transcriptional regulator YbjK
MYICTVAENKWYRARWEEVMSADVEAARAAPRRPASGESTRRRDPVRRQREIIDAAAELVAEVGAAALTHRLVAARAGVPLGSTTQYFATLDDLRAAALTRLADDVRLYVDQVAEAMDESRDVDEAMAMLAKGLHEYLSDERLVRADAMLSASAVLDPQVRPLTDTWYAGLSTVLAARLGAVAAERVVIFIGGATWHAALNALPPSLDTIAGSLGALLEPTSSHTTTRSKNTRTGPRGRGRDVR